MQSTVKSVRTKLRPLCAARIVLTLSEPCLRYEKRPILKLEAISNDSAILKELGKRMRNQRLSVNMTQQRLADLAGMSVLTVSRFERGEDIRLGVLIRLLRALGMQGNLELLIPEEERRPSSYLNEPKGRKRASRKRGGFQENSDTAWVWGDEV